jgi:hypothetical protein
MADAVKIHITEECNKMRTELDAVSKAMAKAADIAVMREDLLRLGAMVESMAKEFSTGMAKMASSKKRAVAPEGQAAVDPAAPTPDATRKKAVTPHSWFREKYSKDADFRARIDAMAVVAALINSPDVKSEQTKKRTAASKLTCVADAISAKHADIVQSEFLAHNTPAGVATPEPF